MKPEEMVNPNLVYIPPETSEPHSEESLDEMFMAGGSLANQIVELIEQPEVLYAAACILMGQQELLPPELDNVAQRGALQGMHARSMTLARAFWAKHRPGVEIRNVRTGEVLR